MIYIVDYDAGNLRSVQKALEKVGGNAEVTDNSEKILSGDKVVFPGVGAFGNAVQALEKRGLRNTLVEYINSGRPFLGICLGMQLLFEQSEENPGVQGLSVLKGTVKRFLFDIKVPHLGWNVLNQKKETVLWNSIPKDSYFYFAHSYYISPDDKDIVIGESDYNGAYPVAVQYKNVMGLQFHPEKSQKNGLQILQNFVNL